MRFRDDIIEYRKVGARERATKTRKEHKEREKILHNKYMKLTLTLTPTHTFLLRFILAPVATRYLTIVILLNITAYINGVCPSLS